MGRSFAKEIVMKPRIIVTVLTCVCAVSLARIGSAEVDVQTPWANVYVGPGGVYVNGPWGRVDVPVADRKRVCRKWRESVEEHYGKRGCEVEFDDDECAIEKVECND